jgi:hypothetical protein
LAAAAVCGAALAQAEPAILLKGELKETYLGARAAAGPGEPGMSVPVSGHRIVGVMAGPMASRADLSRLLVALPAGAGRRICFHSTTRDGLYSARGLLSAATGTGGPARLEHAPRHKAELARYSAEDFAVRVTAGPGCETDPTPIFLVVGYGGGDFLKLMVQSRGAISVRATLTDARGATVSAQCVDDGKASQAFDLECRLSLQGVQRSGNSGLRLAIRSRSGTPSAESATLLWR